MALRSPCHNPEPASSRICRALARCTISRNARSTAREYVRSPLMRVASSSNTSSSTRFVRFIHIKCIIFRSEGFAPRTPLHAPSLAALTARSGRVAHSRARSRPVIRRHQRGALSNRARPCRAAASVGSSCNALVYSSRASRSRPCPSSAAPRVASDAASLPAAAFAWVM